MQEQHIVNLDLPAKERWLFLADFRNEINELLHIYLKDLEGAEYLFDDIRKFKNEIIAQEYLDEIEFIASISNYSTDQVLIANLYYDVLKFYFGCTAFAVESNGSIMHARNLDWWTENNILSAHSRVFNFQKKNKTVFKTVGWLGFVGALSGLKPGKFSITLNAVLSKDAPEIATPVSFLLRDVLEHADSYAAAKKELEQTTIASDCLLLIAGAYKNEMAVIERTPARHATRTSANKHIIVTNDYKLIENYNTGNSELQSTSCGRYEQAKRLIHENSPSSSDDCFEILKDDNVMMGITVPIPLS